MSRSTKDVKPFFAVTQQAGSCINWPPSSKRCLFTERDPSKIHKRQLMPIVMATMDNETRRRYRQMYALHDAS